MYILDVINIRLQNTKLVNLKILIEITQNKDRKD